MGGGRGCSDWRPPAFAGAAVLHGPGPGPDMTGTGPAGILQEHCGGACPSSRAWGLFRCGRRDPHIPHDRSSGSRWGRARGTAPGRISARPRALCCCGAGPWAGL